MIVIGLGNPGTRYSLTRHNVGFLALDRLAEKQKLQWKKKFLKPYVYADLIIADTQHLLVKPLTFMNRSGLVLPYLQKKYGDEMLVLVDNLDLYPGIIRLKKKGSPAGHNGLKSLMAFYSGKDFFRLYIGIGRPSAKQDVIPYVLQKVDEGNTAFFAGIDLAAEAVELALEHGIDAAISRYNKKNG